MPTPPAAPGQSRTAAAVPADLHYPWDIVDGPGILAEGFHTGFCCEYAIALHVHHGWPVRVVCEEMPDGERCLYHAVAERPDGALVDDGFVRSREALIAAYDEYRREHEPDDRGRVVIVPATVADLVDLRDESLCTEALDAADRLVAERADADRVAPIAA